MYEEIALNCFRFLDFKSYAEVDRLTIPEYSLLMKAARMKQVDKHYGIHLQAWLGLKAKATKGKKGKPVYGKFEQFYDYEKELKKAQEAGEEKEKSRFSGIGKLLKKGG